MKMTTWVRYSFAVYAGLLLAGVMGMPWSTAAMRDHYVHHNQWGMVRSWQSPYDTQVQLNWLMVADRPTEGPGEMHDALITEAPEPSPPPRDPTP